MAESKTAVFNYQLTHMSEAEHLDDLCQRGLNPMVKTFKKHCPSCDVRLSLTHSGVTVMAGYEYAGYCHECKSQVIVTVHEE